MVVPTVAGVRVRGIVDTTHRPPASLGVPSMTSHQLRRLWLPGILAPIFLLAACAQTPMGPTVQVMPGPGKSFDAFNYNQSVCKQFAAQAVAGQAENANTRGVGAAALTTVLGAGLGAAIGGGRGAAIGAASGAERRHRNRRRGQFERAIVDPAAIQQRLLPVHVQQGQRGPGLRADDDPAAAGFRRTAPRRRLWPGRGDPGAADLGWATWAARPTAPWGR